MGASANLREAATYIPQGRTADLVYVNWANGDLHACTQAQKEPASVQLPDLTGSHQEGPTNKETHYTKGQKGGLATHRIHEVDSREGAKEGTQS